MGSKFMAERSSRQSSPGRTTISPRWRPWPTPWKPGRNWRHREPLDCNEAEGETSEKGNDMSDTITRWSRSDDAMVENAIRRGASRRDLLKLMVANGVALTAASTVLGRAS